MKNYNKIPLRLILMCKIANIVTVSTNNIAEYLISQVKIKKIKIIDDIAEIFEENSNSLTETKNKEKNLLYFGNEKNTGKKSFRLLKKYTSKLTNESKLIICSNNKIEYDKYFSSCDNVEYTEWSNEDFKKLIKNTDIILLPFMTDERSISRSSNRLTLSLAAKKLVLASIIPSYEKYAKCFIELNEENFEKIIRTDKKELKKLTNELTSEFNVNAHNREIINNWKEAIKMVL
jgi:hypothetical protein